MVQTIACNGEKVYPSKYGKSVDSEKAVWVIVALKLLGFASNINL